MKCRFSSTSTTVRQDHHSSELCWSYAVPSTWGRMKDLISVPIPHCHTPQSHELFSVKLTPTPFTPDIGVLNLLIKKLPMDAHIPCQCYTIPSVTSPSYFPQSFTGISRTFVTEQPFTNPSSIVKDILSPGQVTTASSHSWSPSFNGKQNSSPLLYILFWTAYVNLFPSPNSFATCSSFILQKPIWLYVCS